MEENYQPIVERISETLARVVYDPIKCGLTRNDWIGLHIRLCRESGGATFLNLDDMPRGIVSINWNASKNGAINLNQAIDIVTEAIQASESIYDAMLATSKLQFDSKDWSREEKLPV